MSEQKKMWFWIADYCLKHRLPPAQSWAWERAKKAYRATKGEGNE